MKLDVLSMIVFLLVCSIPAHAQVSNPDLIAQAKKEGRVTWYTTVSIPESKQFMDMFEKQYPFIKVDLLRSGSGPLVNRIVSSREISSAATNHPSANIIPPNSKIRKVTGRLLFKIHLCWLITNET